MTPAIKFAQQQVFVTIWILFLQPISRSECRKICVQIESRRSSHLRESGCHKKLLLLRVSLDGFNTVANQKDERVSFSVLNYTTLIENLSIWLQATRLGGNLDVRRSICA